jgi:hypothetical protein
LALTLDFIQRLIGNSPQASRVSVSAVVVGLNFNAKKEKWKRVT